MTQIDYCRLEGGLIKMLNKDKLDAYFKKEDVVEKEAYKVLKLINRVDEIEGYKDLYIQSIDESSIHFYGSNSWRYGGFEEFKFYFPTSLLYDREHRRKYVGDLIKERIEEIYEDRIYRQKQVEKKKENERKIYENLKNKFETKGE